MALPPATFSEQERIWSGAVKTDIYHHDTSVGRIIFNTMRTWPKNVCQINEADGVATTFGEAITWSVRIAQFFKKRGLGHKDVIGVSIQNSTYAMPLAVACLLNATPFHSISTLLDEATTAHVLALTKPTVIFCDGGDLRKIQAATIGWKPEIYTLTDHVDGVPSIETLLEPTSTEMAYQPEPLKEGGDQTVLILCSSGTTGLPKAVCISNNALKMDTSLVSNELIVFSTSCLDWLTGLVMFIFNTIGGCVRVISNRPFTPEHFVKMVEKYKINVASLPPKYLNALVTCPDATPEALASIILYHFTGGWASKATLQKVQNLCKDAIITCNYGMTEMGIVTSNAGLANMSSVGRPVPGARFRIVDEDGQNLTYNQVGEVYAHTNQVWKGYYGNPEETRSLQDSEGWFHTGDLGYFDEQNFLYIVDRKKEILKYHGLHYWPSEIESTISQMPEVQDVCVVGIYDERVGDEAGALVVTIPGSQLSAQDIVDHVAKHLPAKEKQLHAGVQFTDKLPSNSNGKTLRKAARDIFSSKKGARNGGT